MIERIMFYSAGKRIFPMTGILGIILCLWPLLCEGHEVTPENPVDRRPNLQFIQEADSGFLTGSGGKGYEWRFFKNYAYACGRRGFHTFLIATPVGVGKQAVTMERMEPLPLLIRFRGGGVGYFDGQGLYHGNGEDIINQNTVAQSPLDEENAEALTSHLLAEGIMKKVTADDHTGFRILVISYCDHDLYSGVGEPDPYNPFPPHDNPLTAEQEASPRTTDGLLAAKAAFQYTKALYPTKNEEVVLYGTSAGGMGVLTFATSFGRKGIAFAGGIIDSGAPSPWAEEFVQSDCNAWMKPAQTFFRGIAQRIGPYLDPRYSPLSAAIDHTLATPVFMIWSRGDKSACGETEIAIDSDGDGDAELWWAGTEIMSRPFARILDSHNPGGASRWLRVCVGDGEYRGAYDGPCDQHSPTLYDKRDADAWMWRDRPSSSVGTLGRFPFDYDGDYNNVIYTWIGERLDEARNGMAHLEK